MFDKLSYSGIKYRIEPALGRTLKIEERGCNSKAIRLNENALKEARLLGTKSPMHAYNYISYVIHPELRAYSQEIAMDVVYGGKDTIGNNIYEMAGIKIE